ncbi:hypothetical protein MMC21_002172 [Puttea exsequens]|nr:hypothetical protein [Puttea exsequens]
MDTLSTPPEDPDAQHTVTDFLDYTEYLPSDLARSLTLIGKLDDAFLSSANEVHVLTKQYGSLPGIPPGEKSRPDLIRRHISQRLNHAISCRESSYGEASRLHEMVERHYHRLTNIITKLCALPKPPSRDPTPVPRSPQNTRKNPPARITFRLNGARAAAPANRTPVHPPRRHRKKIYTVPGEVLPPPNPDSPGYLTDSDLESTIPSPVPMPTSRVGGSRKPVRIKPPKPPKLPKLKLPKPPRAPRAPGAVGTNVHSAVAGISTSNALSLLTPPPPDATPGTKHQPWLRLTEWEMAKLRKRMKKNAIWTPSETMIRRELSLAGRGPDNYKSSKKRAEEAREDFVDEDNIADSEPGKPLGPGEISASLLGLSGSSLENRGMKLNEAKKQKREILARERAAELENEAQKLGSLGSTFKDLFSKPAPGTPTISPSIFSQNTPKAKSTEKGKPKAVAKASARKRKHEEASKTVTSSVSNKGTESAISPVKPPKKRKVEQIQPVPLEVTTKTVTTTVPLAALAPSPKRPIRLIAPEPTTTPVMASPEKPKALTNPKTREKDRPTATSTRPRRISLTLKGPTETPPEQVPASPCTSTRATVRRASVDSTPMASTRDRPRRKSATPAPPPSLAPVVTAAGRRSRRPAPGPVVEAGDGPATSVGKRKHAPRKRGAADGKENATKAGEATAGEEVGANEERYCLCGDVSYGPMVACDNGEVSAHQGVCPVKAN